MNLNKKGISLVALVITIIVLIILTVAVILTVTDNNIFNRAENAKNNWNQVSAQEQLIQVVLELKADSLGGAIDKNTLQTKLNAQNSNWGTISSADENGNYTITYNNGDDSTFTYSISPSGNVNYVEPIVASDFTLTDYNNIESINSLNITSLNIPTVNNIDTSDLSILSDIHDGYFFTINNISEGAQLEFGLMAANDIVTTNYIQFSNEGYNDLDKDVYIYLPEEITIFISEDNSREFGPGWICLNMDENNQPEIDNIESISSENISSILNLNNINADISLDTDFNLNLLPILDKLFKIQGN